MAESTVTQAKTFATALVAFALSAFSLYMWKRKSKALDEKIRELQSSLNSVSAKCASERQGRIRAQQDLRKMLAQPNNGNADMASYPMTPIGIVHSCFSTRNGTPRQPLVVPLARASLFFNTSRVPPASLEGLEKYSHCWIIYVFHLNTDLEKLWRNPTKSKFKAKVRVPRLKGSRMGVFSTRSPHRPCPIGLTVAKVEAVQGNMILLSGVDLVDGTPVLDIKPYLPYCDSIQEATVPDWLMTDNLAVGSVNFSEGFTSSLTDCWKNTRNSLYASPDEFQILIRQVLTWDIRSVSQRNRHQNSVTKADDDHLDIPSDIEEHQDKDACTEQSSLCNTETIYHLILEGLDVSYRIDANGNVIVDKISQSSTTSNSRQSGFKPNCPA